MATRQYIGARYVPKFYDYNGSANWRSGVEYEALTIVTRNGNSYTSKIPVPSSVGAPEENPTYWVATGLYNEQVEAYRQLTIALASRVDDVEGDVGTLETTVEGQGTRLTTAEGDIDTLETTVAGQGTRLTSAEGDIDTLETTVAGQGTRLTTAEGDIDTLETAVENLRNIGNRKFVLIGDSYNTGTKAWSSSFISHLGLVAGTNVWNVGLSGAGFATAATNNFLTALTNARNAMTAEQADSITDVVIQGGANDWGYTKAQITAGVQSCESYIRTQFPHAKAWIICAGWSYENATIGGELVYRYDYYWQAAKYAAVIRDVYFMFLDTTNLQSDMVHPTDAAGANLGLTILNAVNGGGVSIYEHSVTAFTIPNQAFRVYGKITKAGVHVYADGTSPLTLATPTLMRIGEEVLFGTQTTLAENHFFQREAVIPMTCRVKYTAESLDQYETANALLIIRKQTNALAWNVYVKLLTAPGRYGYIDAVSEIYPLFNVTLDTTCT